MNRKELKRTIGQEGKLFHSLAMTGVNKNTDLVPKQITDNSLTSCHPDLRPSKRIAFTQLLQPLRRGEVAIVGDSRTRAGEGVNPQGAKKSPLPALRATFFYSSSKTFAKKNLSQNDTQSFCSAESIRGRKIAFTLAEVLITLGIIGVVAAITIPGLIKNYQKKVTVEKLKSTYAIIQQAIKLSEVDNGPLEGWEIPQAAWAADDNYNLGKPFAERYLLPYMKVAIADCGLRPNKCLPDKFIELSGKDTSDSYGAKLNNHYFSFILNNGVLLIMGVSGNSFVFTAILNNKSTVTIGKEAFSIIVTKESVNTHLLIADKPGVYFQGYGRDRETVKNGGLETNNAGCNKSNSGRYCGEMIRLDGWKISKDYPW